MEAEKLKEYFNRIDACSVTIEEDVDFDYIQKKIAKTTLYIEEINTILGELLIDKTILEKKITNKNFEYKVKRVELRRNNEEAKQLGTAKERDEFIDYFLMKEENEELKKLESEDKDLEKLLEFAKKKGRDLDRIYPKLQTLWKTVETEVRYIKKLGSDPEYLSQVRDSLEEDAKPTPLFKDNMVDDMMEDEEIEKELDIEKALDAKKLIEAEDEKEKERWEEEKRELMDKQIQIDEEEKELDFGDDNDIFTEGDVDAEVKALLGEI